MTERGEDCGGRGVRVVSDLTFFLWLYAAVWAGYVLLAWAGVVA